MRLKGKLQQSREWNDLRTWPFHISADESGLRIEFRLVLPDEYKPMPQAGAERLATWADRASGTASQATLEMGRSEEGWDVSLIENGFNCGVIGSVVPGVIYALGKSWEPLILSGDAVVEKYDVYMAPMWQEVSPNHVMEVAETIDADSRMDVDELIDGMKERLSEVAYHVKIGIFVPVSVRTREILGPANLETKNARS